MVEKQKKTIKVDKRILPLAEGVLNELSIDLDTAINIFLYQVFYTQGIPFPVKLPDEEMMERFEMYTHILAGLEDVKAGRTIPGDKVFEEIRKRLDESNGSNL